MSASQPHNASSELDLSATGADANILRLVLTVLLPFGAGYFLANLLRTLNAIIAPQMATDLDLSAANLGGLTAAYFMVFALAQLPVGIALDRWGARRVSSTLLGFAAIGTVLFAVAQNVLMLTVARGLIGLGVSGCLMAALKANTAAWPTKRLPLINSLTATMGMLGSLTSTVPVELATDWLGWRNVVLATMPAIVIVALVIHLVAPRPVPVSVQAFDLGTELKHVARLARDGVFLRLAVPTTIHTATYLAYQSLWAGPWLRDVSGLNRDAVAVALFAFNFGMLIGTISSGWIAAWLGARNVPTIVTLQGALLLSLCCQTIIVLQLIPQPSVMFLAFGLFCSMWFLVYAVLAENFQRAVMGRISTLLNMMIFFTAFVMQWAIGAIIGVWPMPDAIGFSPEGHQLAFGACLALEFITFAWLVAGHRRLHSNERGAQ